jgi:serine/threonine protein kinase/tetratricopeptide (TPR) repeat protein
MIEPFKRESAVFSAARRLPAAERKAYLDQTCAGDAALRQGVEELLQASADGEGFLSDPAPGAQRPDGAPASTPAANTGLGEKAGDRIGHYKLLQQIGEGGCGVVYMAEQEEPVRRRVALKVIKLGMDTKSVIARFEAERQALAMMDHPNIARVFEAGATETGRPYFVMELVRGIKITNYCDEHNLTTRERLELFIQVCHAVQHAHQKGIIHRDLKPSNILVASDDGVAVPKVIDFGIAKATQGRLTDHTLFTAFEQFIGTPAYMSPEQAGLTMQDVDTRTDIYSLGVLLYELLIGRTPFDSKELLASGLDSMRKTIREREPERPSTKLRTMVQDERTTTARHRRTEAVKLQHLLQGDLDWIVIKCLEKDRARRYETANGLSRDVERYLSDEPVLARPPGKLYRLQKLARRNKLTFAATAAVAAALVIGLAASTWEYLKERTARQRAEAAEKAKGLEAAKATAISELLQQMLGAGDPDLLKGTNYTVRQLLDDYSAGLTNQLAAEPEVEATLRQVMGWTYYRLGVLSKAESNLQSSVALWRTVGPSTNALQARHSLVRLLLGERRWEEAAKLCREVWQEREQLFGATHPDTLAAKESYAGVLLTGGRLQEAELIQRQVFQDSEKVLGPTNFDTICALGCLGQIVGSRGARVEAEGYFQEALVRFERIGREGQEDGLQCAKELALSRLLQGHPQDAEKVLTNALRLAIHALGPDHYITSQIERTLARTYAEEGRLDEAEARLKQILDARLRTKADQDVVGTARTQLYLGRVLVENGKPDEAEPLLHDSLALFRDDSSSKAMPELAAQAANWLGAVQLAREEYQKAEALMEPDSGRFFAINAEMSPHERRLAVGHIILLYQALGKTEQAAGLQKRRDAFAPVVGNQ